MTTQTRPRLLPDPEPRATPYVVISVDDHLVEPPDLFDGRLPQKYAEVAPRVVEEADGTQAWHFDGNKYPNIGLNAVVGRPKEDWSMDPARFDEMRPGCYDIDARIRDMDVAGIWASLCFPSLIAGFCGAVFSRCSEPDLGLACMRAWNDWHLDYWASSYPERIIPMQISWLADPQVAAEEVRRNAARGFKALSFAEFPVHMGLPSLHTGHWDPLLQACEETETVVCLHTGSSAWAPLPSYDPPFELFPTLFPMNAFLATADWLWSGVCVKFPELKIALSEGGIGWVAMLADRVDYVMAHSGSGNESTAWRGDLKPSDVLRRNFYFCSIDDPSAIEQRHRIGVDRIMVESDYPHADSTWPDTQAVLGAALGHLPDHEIHAITHGTAARLFRHPLPEGHTCSTC